MTTTSVFEPVLDWAESYTMTSEQVKETYDYSWIKLLNEAQYVSFDTETNARDLFGDPQARVNGFSVCVQTTNGQYIADYFPVNHIDGPNLPRDMVEKMLTIMLSKTIIMHNAIFDLRAFEMLIGDRPLMFFDTMKLAHLHNENALSYSLDECTLRYLGYKGKEKSPQFLAMLNLVGWNGLDFDSIREYGTADAVITYKLWESILRKIKNEPNLPNYWWKVEAPNLESLSYMRKLGVKTNLPLAREMEELGRETMKEIESDLGMKFEGTGSRLNLQKLFWNDLGLPQIINKKTGKPTLDKDALERYEIILERQQNPIARKVLEFRGWQKSVSSFYLPYQTFTDPDGRIRTDFKPHGTVTGRYSSSKPNLQQIPKESDKPWNGRVKECFMPEEGYELWEYDYSQLEFRLAASYAREPKLLDVFNDDTRDIFNEMAADLGLARQDCKTLTYSIQYGAGFPRIMDVFGYSEREARALINQWYETYPGVRRVSEQAKAMAKRDGKVEIWSGRFRHFRFPKSEARKAFNSTIQGGAADMVKVSMNNIREQLPELRMVLQVHDALWFEIPKAEVTTYDPQIRQIMEHPIDSDRVHFKVEGKRVGTLL